MVINHDLSNRLSDWVADMRRGAHSTTTTFTPVPQTVCPGTTCHGHKGPPFFLASKVPHIELVILEHLVVSSWRVPVGTSGFPTSLVRAGLGS